MECACARTRCDIDLAAARSPVFCVVVAAQDLEFCDRIHAGIVQKSEICSTIDVVSTINSPVVHSGASSIHRKVCPIHRSEWIGCSNVQLVSSPIADPRLQSDQLFEYAIVQ